MPVTASRSHLAEKADAFVDPGRPLDGQCTYGRAGKLNAWPSARTVHVRDPARLAVEGRGSDCGLCAVRVGCRDGELDRRTMFHANHRKAAGDRICARVAQVINGEITVDTGLRPDPDRIAAP